MTKQEAHCLRRQLGLMALAGFMASGSFALTARGQDHPMPAMPAPAMNMDKMGSEGHEVAHPFFTHMGMPEAPGVYSLRLGALVTRADGNNDGDFAFHVETGLTDFVGLHLRNNGVSDQQHTELMFQFAAVRSADGMSGLSPIIELEFPTHSGGDQHVNTLVGFSTALANSHAAFNQIMHYDGRTETVEGSAAFVLKSGPRLFPIAEISGEGVKGERPVINLLGGLKARVNNSLLLGIAIQAPVTAREDYSWQLVFQPEIEWGKMK